jgi:hypothetical protein
MFQNALGFPIATRRAAAARTLSYMKAIPNYKKGR